ncbi:hypothetical protein CRE_13789 [Caenorhabditis remanei]|uniref:F-box domain-containing protein n=1 Tax=Caenorhabditis remanei TaxID=31234 RepID=E3NKT6_CAERE|nr:hypothetical protein CRE_13789 [Caenorhabditis remanei]
MPPVLFLQFPQVVLTEIFKFIEFEDLFPLALCSRKSFNIVKTYQDKKSSLQLHITQKYIKIQMGYVDNFKFFVLSPASENSKNVNINGNRIRMELHKTYGFYITYWDDEIKGIKSIFEYLSELFSIKNIKNPTEITVTGRDTVWLMDFIEERQDGGNYKLIIDNCNYQLTNYDYRFIIEHAFPKIIETNEIPAGLQLIEFRKSIDILIIRGRSWIEVDNLISLNCTELVISPYGCEAYIITGLIYHWMAGDLSKLKFFQAPTRNLNLARFFGENIGSAKLELMTEKREYR